MDHYIQAILEKLNLRMRDLQNWLDTSGSPNVVIEIILTIIQSIHYAEHL